VLQMKFGFIGCGRMATALVRGVIDAKAVAPRAILVSDCLASAAKRLARECGVKSLPNNQELGAASDVLVLCVKPGDAVAALREAAPAGKLVISIVAGLPIVRLQEAGGATARIIRVMPNTPALIGKGAAAYAKGRTVREGDAAIAEKIFRSIGAVFEVKEELLDVVTGLSGSGPAYFYLVIEALADGAVLMGLPRDLALQLSAQTAAGAAEMVLRTGEHPAALRDMVASPGGTTIAGLEALEKLGARAAFVAAVRAATERSRALGASK
jgi:pyrroline-5-carboxylate reductase